MPWPPTIDGYLVVNDSMGGQAMIGVSAAIQGSYARGDWGVGSDLDLIVIRASDPPPGEAAPDAAPSSHRLPDVTGLPVPADVLELTTKEWSRGLAEGRRFHTTARREAIWVFGRPPDGHGLDRRNMTARVVPLRSAEAGDARTGGTLEARLAAVDALSAEAWRLSGRPFPSYTRATMPVASELCRITRKARHPGTSTICSRHSSRRACGSWSSAPMRWPRTAFRESRGIFRAEVGTHCATPVDTRS